MQPANERRNTKIVSQLAYVCGPNPSLAHLRQVYKSPPLQQNPSLCNFRQIHALCTAPKIGSSGPRRLRLGEGRFKNKTSNRAVHHGAYQALQFDAEAEAQPQSYGIARGDLNISNLQISDCGSAWAGSSSKAQRTSLSWLSQRCALDRCQHAHC